MALEEIKIEVGQSPETGKWHARMTLPDGTQYLSPACETEADAKAQREQGFKHVLECMGRRVGNVSRVV